jgi:hypothetical protein
VILGQPELLVPQAKQVSRVKQELRATLVLVSKARLALLALLAHLVAQVAPLVSKVLPAQRVVSKAKQVSLVRLVLTGLPAFPVL